MTVTSGEAVLRRTKPVHYLNESRNGPVCVGTGRVRRFSATLTVSSVTCLKCRSVLERRLARVAAEIRNGLGLPG